MAVYNIIYASTADANQASPNDGSYATAREATTLTSTTATNARIGQTFSGGLYSCRQYFPVFDTSAVSNPLTGTFSFNVNTIPGVVADVFELRAVSAVNRLIAGSALASQTPLFGSWTSVTGTGRKTVTINPSGIAISATCSMVFASQNQRLSVAPSGANEGPVIDLADATGTTNDPILTLLGATWEFLGVSNVVEVTATAHPLVTTGIAGTLQAGDLLIACIASRIASTTSISLPTGGEWTRVSEQKTNNVLATTSAAASGMMAYCIRGAVNPGLQFNHPVAPAPAIGRIVAYRNVGPVPLDAQTSFTTASTLSVSGAGLTTTQIEDLVVAMVAGGQEATWSAFNATDPVGASGATDVATAPKTTGWIERADSLTTTSNDTSLAIFDAVKLTAGATGNLTATASLAALHAVIAGAFRIATPVNTDAWNYHDKNPYPAITLSGSDKIATGADNGSAGVRSATAYVHGTAGKYYAEFKVNTKNASGACQLGLKNITQSVIDTTLGWWYQWDTGEVRVDNVSQGFIGAYGTGDVVCIAWDAGAKLIWFRKNNGLWNNSGSADPGSGTGGFAATADTATYALLYRGGWTADQITLRTEAAEYTQTPLPTGFTSWMGETLGAAGVTLTADKGSVALAGIATGLRADRRLTADTRVISVVGTTTGVSKGYLLGASAGAVTVTRFDANLLHKHFYVLPITVGAVTVTFNDANLVKFGAKQLVADTGAVTFAGYAAGLRGGRGVLASKGSVTLAGQAAPLRHTHVLTATTGAVALSGKAATLRTGHVVTVAKGAVTLAGQAVTLRHATVMPAAKGAVTLTGITTQLTYSRKITMAAAPGAVVIAGQPAALIPSTADPVLTAATGAVAVGGQAATLRAARVLQAAPSSQTGDFVDDNGVTSFIDDLGVPLWVDDNGLILGGYGGPVAVTGYAAALTYAPGAVTDIMLSADPGAIAVAGQAAILRYGHALIAAQGAVTVTFNDANLKLRRFLRMIAAPGGIVLSSVPVGLSTAAHKQLAAVKGDILVSGKAATLRVARKLPAISGPIVVTGSAVDLFANVRTHYRLDVASGNIVFTGQQANLLAVVGEKQPGPLVFGRRLILHPRHW